MLKDLRTRALKMRREADIWEGIIDDLDASGMDEVAGDVAENSAEIRARAGLYGANIYDADGGPFRSFEAALLFLTSAAEDTRQAVADDARERDRPFLAALDRTTAGYFREVATAFTLLFKEDENHAKRLTGPGV